MAITDSKIMNDQIFTKGSIQVSPQHLQMLNMQPPKPYKTSANAVASGYKIFLTGYAEHVMNQEINHYRSTMLTKLIQQLQSIPRPVQDGFKMVNTVDTRLASSGSFNVWYKIISGQIVIFNIEVEDEAQKARDKLEKPGLYKMTKNSQGNWTKDIAVKSITTEYAAVNGQSNNLTKATWLMGSHLDFEYGKSKLNEYTLFHNPSVGGLGDTWESMRDKLGFTTDVTKAFSKVLQQTQKEGKEVKWVAHSQGGVIFAEGVRYFLNGNSSWAIFGGFNGIFKDKEEVNLSNHKVAFHGNANNNFRSKFLFDRAGIEVTASRINDYDFVGNVLGMNTINPRKLIGSVVYLNHVTGGSVQQSPHTLAQTQEEWGKNMDTGPGKGRNTVQKIFDNIVDPTGKNAGYINNFLL